MESETRAQTAAIAAGDTAAFARFYDRWFDAMCAEASRATGRDEAFCLDVVQDAMMRVIRSMRPLPAEDDVRRWLRAVVYSCAYDRLRSETRRRRRETAAARTRPMTAPPARNRADEGQRLEWLERQLGSLDDRSLQILLMRHRFGWTLREIGSALKQTPGAVDGRLRRLVRTLRRRAREEADD